MIYVLFVFIPVVVIGFNPSTVKRPFSTLVLSFCTRVMTCDIIEGKINITYTCLIIFAVVVAAVELLSESRYYFY